MLYPWHEEIEKELFKLKKEQSLQLTELQKSVFALAHLKNNVEHNSKKGWFYWTEGY